MTMVISFFRDKYPTVNGCLWAFAVTPAIHLHNLYGIYNIRRDAQMNPYGYYQMPQMPIDQNVYAQPEPMNYYGQPEQVNYYDQQDQVNPYLQPELYDPDRQPQQVERRLNQLERQNERQAREINQLQRRVQRINQRLRAVERRFNFPYTPFDGEY
jgi:hypothetical protein